MGFLKYALGIVVTFFSGGNQFKLDHRVNAIFHKIHISLQTYQTSKLNGLNLNKNMTLPFCHRKL